MPVLKQKPKSFLTLLVPILFLSIFVVVGVGTFIGMYAIPVWHMRQARSWTKTAAVIDKSEINDHQGDESVSYTPNVQYHYRANGQPFTGNRFWFRNFNVNDRKTLENEMKPYTVGAEVDCYYDPKDISSSVLVPRTSLGWFPVLFPMAFIIGPLFMMAIVVMSFRNQPGKNKPSIRKKTVTGSGPISAQSFATTQGSSHSMSEHASYAYESIYCPVEADPSNDQPFVMKPGTTPMGAFLGITLVAAIWNGITYTILFVMLSDRNPSWFPILFLSFFAFIGLILVYAMFHSFLKLFNPRPTLVCSNTYLYPGSELELSWTFSRRSNAMHNLKILLIGIESASYRQGTSTRTETNEFCRRELFHTTEPDQINEGFTLVEIPGDLMYTFTGSNNKVQWYAELVAEIKRWPDVSERFEIKIYPPKLDEVASAETIDS